MHAGSDLLRSKSLDRDSFNSGDWFNRLDFTYQANNWGVGLPVAGKNQDNWGIMAPLLANPDLMPEAGDIELMAALYQDWLAIRDSSELFRLETAVDVQERVVFHNVGTAQLPGLIVMTISDETATDLDPLHEMIVVVINANDEAQSFTDADLVDLELVLHPVLADSLDAVVKTSSFDAAAGTVTVPGRTTAVFVEQIPVTEQIDLLIDKMEQLYQDGEMRWADYRLLKLRLQLTKRFLERGREHVAIRQLNIFNRHVNLLVRWDRLDAAIGAELVEDANAILDRIKNQ
ncbi:MAG: DUF3372 domain-containing protein [Chloroflexi bacterium]|nr:MAG: DUF3372 domain-containing protein [Chloroflexota bacterium]